MAVIQYIKLSDIGFNPDNPRETITTDDLEDIQSVQDMNIALVARPYSKYDVGDVPEDKAFVLIDGNRRATRLLEVAADAQLPIGEKINILPVTREEAYYIMLKTFFKKEQLSVKEECQLVLKVKNSNPDLSQVKLAKLLGVNRQWLRIRLHILGLESNEQEEYFSGEISLRSIIRKKPGDVTSFEVSDVTHPEESPLAGKLVQAGVVRETIAIEDPEDDPFDESVINPSGEVDKPYIHKVPRTKWLCLQDYGPIKELILDHKEDEKSSDFLVKVPNQEAYIKLIEIINGFVAYVGLDKDLKGVLKTYENAVIFKEFPEANGHTRVDVIWKDLADKKEFKLLLERSRKPKVKTHMDDRTTVLTENQFNALKKSNSKISGKIQSYQPNGELVHVRWREYDDHMNAIKWLLENKDAYPLDEFQLKRYTPLTPEQISSVLATGQARKTFYLTTNLSLEELREVLKNIAPGVVVDLHKDPNHYRFYYSDSDEREQITAHVQKENNRLKSLAKDPSVENLVWLDLSAEEFTVLPPRFSPIILREDKLEGGGTRLWFEEWPEQKKVEKYFSPAREFYNKKPIFPIDEDFIRLVHNNSHNMIEFNWKFFQKYYPELNRERIDAKNLWSDLNKNFTISLFERFNSKVAYMKIYIDNFKRALQWVSEYTKLEPNDRVLIAKPCKNCLRMTHLQLSQDLCGNCELSNSQQQKKAAAASKSGGAN